MREPGSSFPSQRSLRRRLGTTPSLVSMALGFCLVVPAALIAQQATPVGSSAGTRYAKWSTKVAPGVRLLRIYDRHGPNRIKVLRIRPQRRVTLDVALSNNQLPGRETTSSMARRHGAIAAINGDYTVPDADPRGSGRPVNIFAEDGSLKTSPLIWGRNFAISQDETKTFVTHTQLMARMMQLDSGVGWQVTRWNERTLARSELSASTPAGGTVSRPPRGACSVRLYPKGSLRWRESLVGIDRRYVVDRVKCSFQRLPRNGGVVISARRRTAAARSMRRTLERTEIIELGWKMKGWPGVLDTIGGNPTLLEKGVRTVEPCSESYFCYRNPRTGIGVTREGTLLLVTVDGRRRGSIGMTPVGFARLFRYLGARSALNLDGGGSTTMVVRGRIVNQPSDTGGERPVGTAVLVLPRADQGEPAPITTLSSTSKTVVAGNAPLVGTDEEPSSPLDDRFEAIDPASTGGMLDALSHGLLGGRRTIHSPDLRRVLHSYRGYYDHRRPLVRGKEIQLPTPLDR